MISRALGGIHFFGERMARTNRSGWSLPNSALMQDEVSKFRPCQTRYTCKGALAVANRCKVVTCTLIPCAAVVFLLNAQAKGTPPSTPEIEQLISQLTNDDSSIAIEAKRSLIKVSADAGPILFAKLDNANWELRSRLLEILSAGSSDFIKEKLVHGAPTDRTYSALAYALSRKRGGSDHNTTECRIMAEELLNAIKSEDKMLRAAAGLALVRDEKDKFFLDHWQEIIPALISSFDVNLVMHSGYREDISDAVIFGICLCLDARIGDHLAFADMSNSLKYVEAPDQGSIISEKKLAKFLVVNRAELDQLRNYWETWWKGHSQLATIDVGTLMIERDIVLFGKFEEQKHDPEYSSWLLSIWIGRDSPTTSDGARKWWAKNKATYRGPIWSSEK